MATKCHSTVAPRGRPSPPLTRTNSTGQPILSPLALKNCMHSGIMKKDMQQKLEERTRTYIIHVPIRCVKSYAVAT